MPPGSGGADPSASREAAELERLRASLRAPEDVLILDLLLGYQQLASGSTDPEVARRARAARNQLEALLRQGGVKGRANEGRVLVLPDGTTVTLRELTAQMSRLLLALPPGGAGPAETERAREIQRSRMDLSFLVEDAEWVLAYAAALEGPLPAAEKARLRRLHESYAAQAPHAEIAAQVNALLKDVRDERLRRELKKLANRSWDRAKRTPAPAPARTPSSPVVGFDDPAPGANAAATGDPLSSPERYCEERRAEAARDFAAARAAANEAQRSALLRQSLAALDDCLQRHPGTEAAQKARRNRENVERELNRK